MENTYNLEKTVWTTADFDSMSWHDNPIHAISFHRDFKLALDIDYIFRWVRKPNAKSFKFWISPCTLIFDNVYNIILDLEISSPDQLIIDNITLSNPRKPKNGDHIKEQLEYDWIIETTTGEIAFTSVGFSQHIRKVPILMTKQKLEIENRGGTSFFTTFEN